jgi:hypothetical protein
MSKGHGAACLCHPGEAVSAREDSSTFAKNGSLSGHPDCNKIPGVETNTGPLGHGLPWRWARSGRQDDRRHWTLTAGGRRELRKAAIGRGHGASQFGLDN